MPKHLFTFEELKQLIEKSAAMRAITPDKLQQIYKQVEDPHSEKAQKLYAILYKERQRYSEIGREFVLKSAQMLDDFRSKVKSVELKVVHKKREEAEAKSKATEEAAAEDLLNILNNNQ